MGVMGAASQDCISAFHRQTSYRHTHIEERAALRLDQRPFLTFFPLQKEHKLRFRLLRDCKSGEIMRNLSSLEGTSIGYQDIRILMRAKPFHSHIGQGRFCPDKDSLLGSWQDSMGTACDGKSDGGRRRLGRASLREEHDGENTRELDGQIDAIVHAIIVGYLKSNCFDWKILKQGDAKNKAARDAPPDGS